ARLDDIFQGVQFGIMNKLDIFIFIIGGALGQLQQLIEQYSPVRRYNVAALSEPENQIPLQLLILFPGLPRQLHLGDSLDLLRHLQPVSGFQAYNNVIYPAVNLVWVLDDPLVNDMSIPLPRSEKPVPILSD